MKCTFSIIPSLDAKKSIETAISLHGFLSVKHVFFGLSLNECVELWYSRIDACNWSYYSDSSSNAKVEVKTMLMTLYFEGKD